MHHVLLPMVTSRLIHGVHDGGHMLILETQDLAIKHALAEDVAHVQRRTD